MFLSVGVLVLHDLVCSNLDEFLSSLQNNRLWKMAGGWGGGEEELVAIAHLCWGLCLAAWDGAH